eukprot:1402020-Heterocapsa_arctica.AAC.1
MKRGDILVAAAGPLGAGARDLWQVALEKSGDPMQGLHFKSLNERVNQDLLGHVRDVASHG